MIKKMAQLHQDFESFVRDVIFNPKINISPDLQKRISSAKEGVFEARDILNNEENPFSDEDLIKKILGNLDEFSLRKNSDLFNTYSDITYTFSLISDFDAPEIISQIEDVYSKILSTTPSSQAAPQVSYEEGEDLPGQEYPSEDSSLQAPTDFSGPWYVSSGSSFSPQDKFFGPFEKEFSAILFSILIHPSGADLSRTVLPKSQALYVLNSLDKTVKNLDMSANIKSESPLNKDLVGRLEQVSREINPKNYIELSTSGEVFDALVEFLEKNIKLSNSGNNTEEVKGAITLDLLKNFSKKFFEIKEFLQKNLGGNAAPEFNKVDVVVTPAESTQPIPGESVQEVKSVDLKSIKIVPFTIEKLEIPKSDRRPPNEVSAALDKSNIETLSVINSDDPRLLSDTQISQFISQMRDRTVYLANIDQEEIQLTFSHCFELLSSFFKECLEKDKAIKKQIFKFREENTFVISESWTPARSAEWEFQNKFSVTKRVMEDPVVSDNLKQFFSSIVEAWFIGKDQKIFKIATIKAKSFSNRFNLKLDEYMINDVASNVTAEMAVEIRKISKNILEEKINEIISSSSFDLYDSSLLLDDIIKNNIKITAYIYNKIQQTLHSKENIIEQESYHTVNCGVCGQATQVPIEYKDDILAFSNNESQYSFFREDGSFISDKELESKEYVISNDAKEIIYSIAMKGKPKSYSSSALSNKLSEFINKSHSWQEINMMIYNPSYFGDKLDEGVLTNIIGHIARNDILKQIGAVPTGSRGIFTNKTLCASSLIKMAESMRQDNKVVSALTKKMDYACLAKVKGSYLPEGVENPQYYSSAYTSFSGPKLSKQEDLSGFGVGYRFSKNYANCPCHIDSSSDIGAMIKRGRNPKDLVGFIAVPNIPENLADSLAKKDGFGATKEQVYFSPTSPDGSLASRYESGEQNLSGIGYLICGKRVSLSMFDKDPSSQNYIGKVLLTILNSYGKDRFTAFVKTLINYGIEINDIKPYVESILSKETEIKSLAAAYPEFSSAPFRKRFLNNLFKKTKVSFAQDISKSDAEIIKELGLVCEGGHKFTLEQSWNFSKTHHGISTFEHSKKKVRHKTILSLLEADKEAAFKILASNSPDIGVGFLRTNVSEKDLRSAGFLMPDEVENYNQLRDLIDSRKLYFKSDDSSIYIFGDPKFGSFKTNPWDYNRIQTGSRTDLKINRYSSGMQSTTTVGEDGKETELDIEDYAASSFDEEVMSDVGQSDYTSELQKRYDIIDILMPGILQRGLNLSLDYPDPEKKIIFFNEKSSEFIDKFARTLKMSRIWGKMSSDDHIDFLAQAKRIPEVGPSLRKNIETALLNIALEFNISSERLPQIYQRFFDAYDVFGLAERNISYNAFLSLAGLAQYYKGFVPPNIINMDSKSASESIINEIYNGIKNNLDYIFEINKEIVYQSLYSKVVESNVRSLAVELFSPYRGYSPEFILENSIVNYTGRAIVFSYAIDMLNSIRTFYYKYFFNKASSLYIGPINSSDQEVFDKLTEMLGLTESSGSEGISVPKILIMEEAEFEQKIAELKDGLRKIYNPDTVFTAYMRMKGLALERNVENIYNIQRAVVFSRFGQCLQMASSSLDSLISDLSIKPLGASGTKVAAQILDSAMETLVRQRNPESFEENKPKIIESRMLFGEASQVFEKNAVQYGRINLDSSSIPLEYKGDNYPAPLTYNSGNTCFLINKNFLLNGNDYTYKSGKIEDPYLILIRKIVLSSESAESRSGQSVYICVVPKDIMIKKISSENREDLLQNIDLLSLIPPNVIRLNSEQGIEFASRYISNIRDFDTSRLILVNESYAVGQFFVRKKSDSSVEMAILNSSVFDIRIQKIKKDIYASWPPPINMFVNSFYVARSPDDSEDKYPTNFLENLKEWFSGDRSQHVESYFRRLFGEDSIEFLQNIEKFNISDISRTMGQYFSHGLVLPFGGASNFISMVVNDIEKENFGKEKVGMTISDHKISVPRQGKDPLNISWIFATNDPQVIGDDGIVKLKLVQSGIIQKLHYVSSQVKSLYSWFSSKGIREICEYIDENDIGAGIYFDSQDEFLNSLFSDGSSFADSYLDSASGLILVSPRPNSIISSYPESAKVNTGQFLQKLGELCEFCNAARKLNKLYLEQRPLLSSTSAINLAAKEKSSIKEPKSQQALCLNVLDPYSLWLMVNNPMMHTTFGGPIKPDDIDDYKQFIIATYGLEELRNQILKETGFNENEFMVDDLFDLVGFYNKYAKKGEGYKDQLTKYAKLFKLVFDEEGNVRTYGFGIPTRVEKTPYLAKMTESFGLSEYSIHPSSYIEYPAKLSSSLDDLTDTQIKKIFAEADAATKELIPEIEREILDLNPNISKKDLKTKALSHPRIREAKRNFISNHPLILKSRERARALNSGEEVLSIEEMVSLATSQFSTERPKLLSREVLKIAKDLWGSPIRKISRRKIAQIQTDEEGTIIKSLYQRWWDAYLKIVAQTQN